MNIQIENPSQLKMVKDFAQFIEAHNERSMKRKADPESDSYDLLVRQASLINSMANSLAVKQTEISALKTEINELKAKIKELEQEIRVSKDLLTIAKAVDDAK